MPHSTWIFVFDFGETLNRRQKHRSMSCLKLKWNGKMHESDAVVENERYEMQNGSSNLNSMTHNALVTISFTCCLLRCDNRAKGETFEGS